jgi:HEAT repeat protein
MTLAQLRMQLSAIEPNDSTYAGIGPADVPLLKQLLHEDELWMASRAVCALSRVRDPGALTALTQAAADPREGVRVTVAASVHNLKPADASPLLTQLLVDKEMGVRKFAVEAVSQSHDRAVSEKLKEIEQRDPVPAIRDLAKDQLQKIR